MCSLRLSIWASGRVAAARADVSSDRNLNDSDSRNLQQHRPLHHRPSRRQQDGLRMRPAGMSASLHLLLKFYETSQNARDERRDATGDDFERHGHVVRRYFSDGRKASRGREKVSVRTMFEAVSDEQRFEASRRCAHRQSRVPVLLLQPQIWTKRSPNETREENARCRIVAAAATKSSKSDDSAHFFLQNLAPSPSLSN